MTVLYKPVLIESVEQAEALPIGTVSSTATLPIFMKVSEEWWVGVHGPDSDDDEKFENCDAMGITALVSIEAEEEWAAEFDSGELYMNLDEDSARGADGGAAMSRFVTPWEEVSDKP